MTINGFNVDILGTGFGMSFSENNLSEIQKKFLEIVKKYKHILICGNGSNDSEKRGFENGRVYSLKEELNKDITEEFGYNPIPTEIIRILNELAEHGIILKDNQGLGAEFYIN